MLRVFQGFLFFFCCEDQLLVRRPCTLVVVSVAACSPLDLGPESLPERESGFF
jgi:hypothetical protein